MLAIQKVGNDFHVKSLDGELLVVFSNKTIFTIKEHIMAIAQQSNSIFYQY